MGFFQKLSDGIYVIEKWLSIIFTFIMFSSLVAGVVFRYIVNYALQWSDELAIFCLVWITFLGGSIGIKKQETAAVTILSDKLKGTSRRIIISAGLGILTLFTAYVSYLSITWIISPSMKFEKSISMEIPMIYPNLIVPIGMLFITVHSFNLFLISLSGKEEL